MTKRLVGLLLIALAVLAAAGCESLAGIEDRTYDLGDEAPASAQCASYCNEVMANCTGTNAVYSGMQTCLGVCAKLPPGDALEPAGNTVACRTVQAGLAASSSTGEPELYCPRAGPGGADFCGTNCESYCLLLEKSCPTEFQGVPSCTAKCAAFKDMKRFDVIADHEGDSLQCRLVHVSSATVEPEDHCPHAQFRPSKPWCVDTGLPNCDDYCRVVMTACQGAVAQYETLAQCKSACATLTVGVLSDTDDKTDTLGCRTYHSYSSLAQPDTHCSHSGPLGDGHCGTSNCPSYCAIVAAACPTQFDQQFPTDGQCERECAELSGAGLDQKFSTTNTEKTVSCRTLKALKAFTDPSQCAAAVGAVAACP